jgi:PAS domain S-box-containing protein
MVDQERATKEEHSRLRSILASLGDAVVAVDRDGHNVATNPVYDRLFGGTRDTEIQPEDVAGVPIPREAWPQLRASRGERFRMEFAIPQPDGTRRWFEAVAEPLTSEDRTWGGVVTFRDLSERTMRVSLERLMAAAGHELKTPTAAIHNYLQLVERRLETGDASDAVTYAERASVQTRRLGELVDRLFDVSRIQSGRLALLLEPIDLVQVVREATEVAGVLPGAPSIRLSATPRTLDLRGDTGRLQQVFLNLLANAIDHAGGSATIDVVVRRAGRVAIVEVSDHGKGVAPEDVATMFDAYARTGSSPRPAGLGLGLFVSREIVTAHGGEIRVVSTVGEGTTMTVRLPVGSTPTTKPSKAARPPRTARSAGTAKPARTAKSATKRA